MRPVVGELGAAGLTVAQLQQTIVTKLSDDIMFNPVVNIQVLKVNSKKVPAPEEFDHFRCPVGCGRIQGFCAEERGGQQIKFDYNQVSRGKHMEQNVPVLNGDHIIVPEN